MRVCIDEEYIRERVRGGRERMRETEREIGAVPISDGDSRRLRDTFGHALRPHFYRSAGLISLAGEAAGLLDVIKR